jgi:hypothetical protein
LAGHFLPLSIESTSSDPMLFFSGSEILKGKVKNQCLLQDFKALEGVNGIAEHQ